MSDSSVSCERTYSAIGYKVLIFLMFTRRPIDDLLYYANNLLCITKCLFM